MQPNKSLHAAILHAIRYTSDGPIDCTISLFYRSCTKPDKQDDSHVSIGETIDYIGRLRQRGNFYQNGYCHS